MNTYNHRQFCPCCGYAKLSVKPYKDYEGPPVSEGVEPPYRLLMGEPSYEVCLCCGYEFGNDDEPGTSEPISFGRYLHDWVKDGCAWFDSEAQPPGWHLEEQLRLAGIPVTRIC